MIDAVAYYQQHGFFQNHVGLPDWAFEEALGIYRTRWSRTGHVEAPWKGRAQRELGILELDEERILDLDFEAFGVGGGDMYISTIPRLARITRGVFSAWDVREKALDEERGGLVKLTFRRGADLHEHMVYGGNDDWIDPQILWIIEEFLHVSPYRFYAAAESVGEFANTQGALLTCLSAEERDRIDRDRGVVFVPLPPEPDAPWNWDPEQLTKQARGER